ncbi:MAG: serine/threonine-protein kinase [Polyangiales bacterium]
MNGPELERIHHGFACTYCDDTDGSSSLTHLGRTVGSHKVVRQLARGGSSRVFLAEDLMTGEYAAVKLPDARDSVPSGLFTREAALLARLQHPHIVRAVEEGRLHDGTEYLLLEYVSGIDLDDWLTHFGGMPWPRVLHVARQLAAAVDHMHAHGIVHSDIKPSNVMLDAHAQDHVTLLDFGVAFDLHTEREHRGSSGTPGYMAPEQQRGEGCGPAADRYGVAAIALELLTGVRRSPGRRGTKKSIARIEALRLPVRRKRALISVFEKGLHDRPSSRYDSAQSFVDALECASPTRLSA